MSSIAEEFFRWNVYKRSQGRIVRQATFAAIALAILVGLWQLSGWMKSLVPQDSGAPAPGWMTAVCYGLPALLGVFGVWAAYRSVNLPLFADFLISVEAEMNKVSWPSWKELVRWSVVVILMIFTIGFVLAAFDMIWVFIFKWLGIYSA